MHSCIDPIKKGITHTRRSIYNIKRRLKIMGVLLKFRNMRGILIGHPPGINGSLVKDGIYMNAVLH